MVYVRIGSPLAFNGRGGRLIFRPLIGEKTARFFGNLKNFITIIIIEGVGVVDKWAGVW